MCVVVGKETGWTIHRISTAVQIVRMEPLVGLADGHTGAISISDGDLLISAICAFFHAEMHNRICK